MNVFCPRCGQPQNGTHTRFCSRCGFLMAGLQRIVENGGVSADIFATDGEEWVSPKKQGLKQGGIMMLSSLVVVPVLGILVAVLNLEGFLPGAAFIILFWGGLLRMIYALIFQPGRPTPPEKAGFFESLRQTFLGSSKQSHALPEGFSQPAQADFQPAQSSWKDNFFTAENGQ